MNTLVKNKIRQIANRMLEITCYLNKADHVDVKTFIGHCGAEADRAKLVELHNLYVELKSIKELREALKQLEVIEPNSLEDLAHTAACEYSYFIEDLKEDIVCKLEKRSRNTFYSAEENYEIAKWFNDGFAAKTGRNLYQEYMDALHEEAIRYDKYLSKRPSLIAEEREILCFICGETVIKEAGEESVKCKCGFVYEV